MDKRSQADILASVAFHRAFEIAQEFFPDATEGELNNILWEHTGYPIFWDGDPETCLRRQLSALVQLPHKLPDPLQ